MQEGGMIRLLKPVHKHPFLRPYVRISKETAKRVSGQVRKNPTVLSRVWMIPGFSLLIGSPQIHMQVLRGAPKSITFSVSPKSSNTVQTNIEKSGGQAAKGPCFLSLLVSKTH